MFAAHGAEVRIYGLAEAQRQAAVDFVAQNLPALADRLTGVVPGQVSPRPSLPKRCTTRGWSSRRSRSGSN